MNVANLVIESMEQNVATMIENIKEEIEALKYDRERALKGHSPAGVEYADAMLKELYDDLRKIEG